MTKKTTRAQTTGAATGGPVKRRRGGRRRARADQRAWAAKRTGRVMAALDDHYATHGPGAVIARRTRHGEIHIRRIAQRTSARGIPMVEVWLAAPLAFERATAPAGAPHYRIINPPALVADPAGPIERAGRRWREDPLQVLAEVIAQHRHTHRKRDREGRR